MFNIEWDKVSERLFETGTDRGVLYPFNKTSKAYDKGVAWNGLTGVTETPSGAEPTALYADGGIWHMSEKVVVTKSKLDELANVTNEKAGTTGKKTIDQLKETVTNDIKGSDITLGITGANNTCRHPVINEFDEQGRPTSWFAADLALQVGYQVVRAGYLTICTDQWVALQEGSADAIGNDYSCTVTDSSLFKYHNNGAYWYVCFPSPNSYLKNFYAYNIYISHERRIDENTLTVFCSAVDGKPPESDVNLVVLGFPTAWS